MHFNMIVWRSLRNDNVPFPNLKWTHNSNSFILYISFYGTSTSPPAAYFVKNMEGEKKEILAKLSPLRKGFMILSVVAGVVAALSSLSHPANFFVLSSKTCLP